MWFAVFPTYETLIAQGLAAILVVGSYYAARHFGSVTDHEIVAEPDAAIVRQLETVP